MLWTVPNILTMGRVLAAPLVALAFVVFDRPLADWVAFVLLAVAAATDFFDGWLARRWGQVTEIGKMLDPIADKAMVVIALAVLMAMFGFHFLIVVPAVLILLREVLVSGLREYLGGVKLSVTRLAKWKTTAQMVAIGLLFLALALGAVDAKAVPDWQRDLPVLRDASGGLAGLSFAAGWILLWVAAFLTVASGVDYFRKGAVELRKREVNR